MSILSNDAVKAEKKIGDSHCNVTNPSEWIWHDFLTFSFYMSSNRLTNNQTQHLCNIGKKL